jgi:hypothetical protein
VILKTHADSTPLPENGVAGTGNLPAVRETRSGNVPAPDAGGQSK